MFLTKKSHQEKKEKFLHFAKKQDCDFKNADKENTMPQL